MRPNLTKRQIFELVAKSEITTDEGIELIKNIGAKTYAPDPSRTDTSFPVQFYNPVWMLDKPLDQITAPESEDNSPVLVFEPRHSICGAQSDWWETGSLGGRPIYIVRPGTKFQKISDCVFQIDPLQQADYLSLAAELYSLGRKPGSILFGWAPVMFDTKQKEFADHEIPGLTSRLVPLFNLLKCASNFKGLKQLIYMFSGDRTQVDPLRECAPALGACLGLVYPDIRFRSIKFADSLNDSDSLRRMLAYELGSNGSPGDSEVLYHSGGRHLKQMEKMEPSDSRQSPFVEKGVYLITGGGGALAHIFARFLAKEYSAAIVLTDLMEMNARLGATISELEALGATVRYFQADVSDSQAMTAVVARVNEQLGGVNGVIHAAGLNNDVPLNRKSADEFLQTLAPKINGTIALDWATRGETLDFFVMFSSSASIMGDFGQCDYALASRFLDCYSQLRNEWRIQKKRSGLTTVIDWHLWRDGGMHLDAEGENLYLASTGMGYLETEQGIRAFVDILNQGWNQALVISGDPVRLSRFFGGETTEAADVGEMFESEIRQMAATVIKLDPDRLDMDETLGNFGFDSIALKSFADQLNKKFNISVSPAVFFKHPNLNSLKHYLLDSYKTEISGACATPKPVEIPHVSRSRRLLPAYPGKKAPRRDDVAIIGAAGIFPGAWDLDEFWKHLREGRNLISEVPEERWDWREYKAHPPARWGGFISDVDTFDGRFFNISPREAELMDPQNRLFLEVCWRSIEDAGYDVTTLSGAKIGVFAGVQFSDYEQLLRDAGPVTAQVGTGNSHAMISNRVSYIFDFHGPSESIDTACSGSLVAVNRAVRSVRAKECEMALCGGVSLILSPDNILAAAQLGVLSPDGRCKTFDRSANGYVKGEGVGAVLIKPLAAAIRDRDHIYAVIKGTAVNHGGKANSLTAPNSESQAEVMVAAYQDAAVDIDTVSYIEAHGTGTELGDPVEIEGLKLAFEKLSRSRSTTSAGPHTCGLGSVKTNIGHLEPASGIAGILKVVLAMKHKMLPPSIHMNSLNPYIDFKGTPFYVVDQLSEWRPPLRAGVSSFGFGGANAHVVLEDYSPKHEERRSSKPEACIVPLSAQDGEQLREYARSLASFIENAASPAVDNQTASSESISRLKRDLLNISSELLSVHSGEIDMDNDLRDYGFEPVHFSDLTDRINEKFNYPVTLDDVMQESTIGKLSELIAGRQDSPVSSLHIDSTMELPDIAFTLQTGRAAKKTRLALVVSSVGQLVSHLKMFCRGEESIPGLFTGEVKGNDVAGAVPEERDLSAIAGAWVSGAPIDWSRLHRNRSPHRLSLPTYPFKRRRYWIPKGDPKELAPSTNGGVEFLHPLIDRNTSTFKTQRYSTRFQGGEFFLADHVINGKPVLPGVAYIEMARAAGQLSTGIPVESVKNIVWISPLTVESESANVHIDLLPIKDKKNQAEFEIYSRIDQGPRTTHCRGKLIFAPQDPGSGESSGRSPVNISELVNSLHHSMGRNVCYDMFSNAGIAYGPGFQAIRQLYCGGSQAVARIELPESTAGNGSGFLLHPSLMDAALQAVVGLRDDAGEPAVSPYIPFSMDEVRIFEALPRQCYAHVTPGRGSANPNAPVRSYNIELLDNDGRVLVQIKQFTVKEFKDQSQSPLYFTPRWTPDEAGTELIDGSLLSGKKTLVFSVGGAYEENVPSNAVRVECASGFSQPDEQSFAIDPQDESHYRRLFDRLEESGTLPDVILHLWGLDRHNSGVSSDIPPERWFDTGLFSVFYIAGEMMKRRPKSDAALLYFHPYSKHGPHPHCAALAGFCRSIQREHPKFMCRTIQLDISSGDAPVVEIAGREFARGFGDVDVRYDPTTGRRLTPSWEEEQLPDGEFSIKNGGVYLITGGLGKLGMLFAEFFQSLGPVRLALIDRVELSGDAKSSVESLQSSTGEAAYWQADLADKNEVVQVVRRVKERWGHINGVIHCAGVNRDAPVVKKTRRQMDDVLGPKVYGTLFLDEASKNESLDFFVLFSSFTSVIGNAGQSDYAFANNYLDHFALQREGARQAGQRRGKTLAVNWPLWKSGGMTVDAQTERLMATTTGMTPLSNQAGIEAFKRVMALDRSQVAVIAGDNSKIKKMILSVPANDSIPRSPSVKSKNHKNASRTIRHTLVNIAVEILKMPAGELDVDSELQEYGFDSITLTEFANKINENLGLEITPAVFFELEHSTISVLAHHLWEKYPGLSAAEDVEEEAKPATTRQEQEWGSRFESGTMVETVPVSEAPAPEVAIVGMDAVFPKSKDIDSFWLHLEKGEDLISEVPAGRWDWRALFGQQSGARWGGFMEDIDMFDPLFFGISQREAKLMDPQQRIILQIVWRAVEDAGYRAGALSGLNVGVFIGVSTTDYYELWRASTNEMEPYMATGMSHSIVANRISYLLNVHGPSESVDTACSSSLVAMARGVEAIQKGTCEMVIAGGVNLLVSPTLFQAFDAAGMLSADGRCRTFDRQANGYVRGEGAGAILMKPLNRAVADGDHIYGVVKGAALNHGGRANSLTAPNAAAQADLLVDAYQSAGIDPSTVGFIETHGTGTTLGDPVEINGLKLAFSRLYSHAGLPVNEGRRCGLGSVKTNIGHLEAAAGIAGIVKVLLAMKHQTLPATVHFNTLNQYIDLEESPFYIVEKTSKWERFKGDDGEQIPLRAGVSSFGFGGANAHIILEEFPQTRRSPASVPPPYIFVLSAKTEERLKVYAGKIAAFLETFNAGHEAGAADISDIIYTLQVGREAMEARLAVIASDGAELVQVLSRFKDAPQDVNHASVFYDNGQQRRSVVDDVLDGDLHEEIVNSILERRDWGKLAQLWVSGMEFDWTRLYNGGFPNRISLPAYPFETKRYWFDSSPKSQETPKLEIQLEQPPKPEKLTLRLKGEETSTTAAVDVKGAIIGHLSRILHADKSELPENVPMQEFGLDSIGSVELVKSLNQDFGIELKTVELYDYSTIEKLAGRIGAPAPAKMRLKMSAPPSKEIEPANLKSVIVKRLADILHADPDEIDHNTPLQEIGLDSIGGTELINSLNLKFSLQLKAASLYDYPTVNKLADFIAPQVKTGASPVTLPVVLPEHTAPSSSGPLEVAVIGMSARFPGASDVSEFWENLKNGVDSISEVPSSRWDVQRYFDPDPGKPNKTYCKWGGFIDGIDEFDPLFFRIAPSDAEVIDPQQRLFMEECVKAFEDAGYAPEELSGIKCGVFAGVLNYNEYSNILQGRYEDGQLGQLMLGNSNSILAARACYFLNLKGPAIAMDTACSSSLVAIHQACKSIQNGETEMMLAGGVILCMIHERYLLTSKTGALSPRGRCSTFDNSADGYVPGEGVGVIVMKGLNRAMADGDHIYGVIKGSALNQDGTTNGITAPSADSQKNLELEVYRTFKIHPETISYVEAHGTGTKLGDPIEVEALNGAFREFTEKRQFCAIGSVKTNIGHLASAAGVASVIKVLLSLQHRQIPPSLHFSKANEHIDFEETPFFVNTELRDWEAKEGVPRRATVSAFGLSGTNCHMVIEEPPPPASSRRSVSLPAYIMAFSARTSVALRERIMAMKTWLDEAEKDLSLADVSFTLLAGRSHFDHRAAFVVKDKHELAHTLGKVLADSGDPVTGESRKLLAEQGRESDGSPEGYAGDLIRLAGLYMDGERLDWRTLFAGKEVSRLSLPTYPFSRDSFWVGDDKEDGAAIHWSPLSKVHPFIDANESTFNQSKFRLRVLGDEFFITDHVIEGEKVFPAVAYAEMARAAGELASGRKVAKLKNIIFAQPIAIGDRPKDIIINFLKNNQNIEFKISTAAGEEAVEHSQGVLVFEREKNDGPAAAGMSVDVEAVKARCEGELKPQNIYRMFRQGGVEYGDCFQTIQQLYYSEKEALALLSLNKKAGRFLEDFLMHPSFMDGLLQTTLGLALGDTSRMEGTNYLPFVLGEIEFIVREPLPERCFAYATRASVSRKGSAGVMTFNMDLLDETGRVRIRMKNFAVRAVQDHDLTYMKPVWRQTDVPEAFGKIADIPATPLIVFELDETLSDSLPYQTVVSVKPGPEFRQIDENRFQINPGKEEDYKALLAAVERNGAFPAAFIHNWSGGGGGDHDPSFEETMERGLYSIFHLVKALVGQKIRKSTHCLFVSPCVPGSCIPQLAAVSGFVRSVAREHPRLVFKTLELDSQTHDKTLGETLLWEMATADNSSVRYVNGERFARRLEKISDTTQNKIPLKTNGIYIITGGGGGLGLIFAEYLAKEYSARLVLTGRSPLDAARKAKIESLNGLGGDVVYIPADVSKREDVDMLLARTKELHSGIDGVIHGAGVIADGLVAGKTLEQVKEVLAPKVFGAIHLDDALAGERLDFFVLFSAVAGEFGNPGQADYAYANSFLDHFAVRRHGKTVSIDWTLWQEGGMKLDERMLALRKETIGVKPISTGMGINAFLTGLGSDERQLILAHGDEAHIRDLHSFNKGETTTESTAPAAVSALDTELIRPLQGDLVALVDQLLKMKGNSTDPTKNLREYGFDSINLTVLANRINERYSLDMTPAAFFELETLTLESLTRYLLEEYSRRMAAYYTDRSQQSSQDDLLEDRSSLDSSGEFIGTLSVENTVVEPAVEGRKDCTVVIIGMGGRMPMADSLDEFWNLLEKGRSMISQIPADRWDWRDYDGDHKNGENKTKCRWGGFMNRVDAFDAQFFNISPREAQLMDPQQRLVLETIWEVMEDAGYRMSDLAETRTGLFVGVSNSDYSHLLAGSLPDIQAQAATGLSHSIIANRVSYWLDLRGPSEVINTACSSSLVAIHRAVESLRNTSCSMAFAGGVNVIASPTVHVAVGKVGILSDDGTCRTFDSQANGIVRGEGVGAVLLKPLDAALADGDHIYCEIAGSGENHGGRSTSLTAPNPHAQAALLTDVYSRAKVSPDTVNYIECHGTGTKLGDPVEVNGLKKAWAALSRQFPAADSRNHYCGIGSVKTNVGHLEAAAGIAGVFKVILGMKNRKIPATINYSTLNPFIELQNSPFYIVSETREWKPALDAGGNELPRRAGVSSFGLGGTNAHIILQEYRPEASPASSGEWGPQIIVLSALNEAALKRYAGRLAEYIEARLDRRGHRRDIMNTVSSLAAKVLSLNSDDLDADTDWSSLGLDPVKLAEFSRQLNEAFGMETGVESLAERETIRNLSDYLAAGIEPSPVESPLSLLDVAYTLQLGRQPQQERMAVVCRDMVDLIGKLEGFRDGAYDGSAGADGVYHGSVRDDSSAIDIFTTGKSGADFMRAVIAEGEIGKLAQMWVMGASIEWGGLYVDRQPRKVSLPTYPFERQSYWIPGTPKKAEVSLDFLLEPQWELAPLSSDGSKAGHDIVVIYSQESEQLAEEIKHFHQAANCRLVEVAEILLDAEGALKQFPSIDSVYFIGGLNPQPFDPEDLGELEAAQERGVVSLFRLVKALGALEFLKNGPTVKIVTNNCYAIGAGDMINPASAALLGFSRSLAREWYHLDVSVVDIAFGQKDDDLQLLARSIALEPPHKNGDIVALRGENRYACSMGWTSLPAVSGTPFRERGVYLIAGGGKGIGFELCRYLVKSVQARVILLGRSPMDSTQEREIAALEAMGGEVVYLQADLTDFNNLSAAVDQASAVFGTIHGVIHSAVVLRDKTVANMEEQELMAVLEPKAIGAFNLHKAVGAIDLDFMLFFSSAVSFTSNPGQSNYAAANTFEDAFAHYLNQEKSYPVKTVNWGFWGSVGVVSSDEYRDRMNAQGVYSITPAEGMEIISRLVRSGGDQIIALKAADSVLEQLTAQETPKVEEIQEATPQTQALEERLTEIVGAALHYDPGQLDPKKSFMDLGVDSVLAIELAGKMSDALQVKLNPADLYNYSTLESLASFIKAEFATPPADEDEEALRLLRRLESGELDVVGVSSQIDLIYNGNIGH
jgi:acyl transferase domain-containing protein/dTDP-4-dehydrorhamnose reductase